MHFATAALNIAAHNSIIDKRTKSHTRAFGIDMIVAWWLESGTSFSRPNEYDITDKDGIMMTSSNGNLFRVIGDLYGEVTGPGDFPAQRPVTRSFDVFFDLRLNKRLSKQS